MTFTEAAMIMMSGDTEPVMSPPLSLEGIKSLKTVATITVGDYVFKLKEPKKFFAGTPYVGSVNTSNLTTLWWPSLSINDTVAYVGSDNGNLIHDYTEWGDFTLDDGRKYSSRFRKYSDFKVTELTYDPRTGDLPHISIKFSCNFLVGIDIIAPQSSVYTWSANIGDSAWGTPRFTNLSDLEYCEFTRAIVEAGKINTPIINIL